MQYSRPSRRLFLLPLTAFFMAACATSMSPPTTVSEVGEVSPGHRLGIVNGYLPKSEWVDDIALLPPPPDPASAVFEDDRQTHIAMKKLRDTPRGELATRDAELRFPQAAGHFSCALGVEISAERTPHLNMLMRRSMTDAGLATFAAKDKYQRQRPFVAFGESTCTPDENESLARNGSYPSAHSAEGWAWALILAEMAPDRADAIFQRGRSFGQSRVICGAHWKSDVESGRLIGAATVALLHANPIFQAQFQAAKTELAQAEEQGWKPDANQCAAEAEAQLSSSQLAP